MRSLYELQAEEQEVLGKIVELEKIAITEIDIRELKRLRKRSFELQDELTVARNKERLADREVSIQLIRDYEGKNQESYGEVIRIATEMLPKLKKVDKLLKQLALNQNKLVYSGQEAGNIARQVQVQSGDTIPLDLKPHILVTTIDPSVVEDSIKKLELLLAGNQVTPDKDKDNDDEPEQNE